MSLPHRQPTRAHRHLTLVPPLSEPSTLRDFIATSPADPLAPAMTIPTFDPDLPTQMQRSLRSATCFLWLPHLVSMLPERCPSMNPVRRYAADALTNGRLRDAAELYTRLYRYLADTQGGTDPTGGRGPVPDPLGTPTVLPIRQGARP